MRVILILIGLMYGLLPMYGQIEQEVRKRDGEVIKQRIERIDSIRFDVESSEMEIKMREGDLEIYELGDILEVGFVGKRKGEIEALDCEAAVVSDEVVEGIAVSGVSIEVGYTGGNGGAYGSQSIVSSDVLGLTASLAAGQFNVGVGSVVLTIAGTAESSGVAVFLLELGGQSCEIEVEVEEGEGTSYPPGTVHCDPDNPTAVVDVLNPATGKTWMDRNLGASHVAQAFNDPLSYGDLYQWGRLADGHQCRNSGTTTQLSSSDVPGHGDFILNISSPHNWRSPQNPNLWQGVNGVNNPCPSGYRVPTESELNAERLSWSTNNSAGAFASPLKLPSAGYRDFSVGSLIVVGTDGFYWSSTVSSTNSRSLFFSSSTALMFTYNRAYGFSVRCLKEVIEGEIGTLDCEGATLSGEVVEGVELNGVSIEVGYTGGNGGPYESLSIASTGVLGLTASLSAGEFNVGAGTVVLTVTGTAQSSGVAAFVLELGGQSCELEVEVEEGDPGTVHCDPDNPTAVIEVLNPATGKTWMDRNLGASQVAQAFDDPLSYGDLYQWGRLADGHQCRNSAITDQSSSSDVPGHGDFYTTFSSPWDWRRPQNDNLWQGVNGVNNPCPSGYRVPTESELNTERLSWSSNNRMGAFASPLKLPSAGLRTSGDGVPVSGGTSGYYWSSTVSSIRSRNLRFTSSTAYISTSSIRASGYSVRCLREEIGGEIEELDCAEAAVTGEVVEGLAVSGVSIEVGYTSGNGGPYEPQSIASTGVLGLTATLPAGQFNVGVGSVLLTITGTAQSSGLAVFLLELGGQSCSVEVDVEEGEEISYPPGTVHCDPDNSTMVIDVLNPSTGKTWMDRNLGASQVAQAYNDPLSYGDLYQWGRLADGHQCRTSPNNPQLSSSDVPGHGDFIQASGSPDDWRSPQNDNLWQGVNGVNNPCPIGYRVPTESELNAERLSWNSNSRSGAFASPLKFPSAGYRSGAGSLFDVGTDGYYWSSTVSSTRSRYLYFYNSSATMNATVRARGISVRCLKEVIEGEIGTLDCEGATLSGEVVEGVELNGVSIELGYTGGNGGAYGSQSIASTGVLGLTASLSAGEFNVGSGSVVLTIAGTAESSGVAAFVLELGGQSCELEVEVISGEVSNLDCEGATLSGEVVEGIAVSGVSIEVGYTGGNGGAYAAQEISSTGVLGLTASLAAGQFNVGAGSMVLTIAGTAQSSGVAVFVLELGGQSCELEVEVEGIGAEPDYPPGTVHCDPDNITLIVDVLNPSTGKTWMDRNLGASQVAQAFNDPLSYGDLYQWGRLADGHQCRNSGTTTQLSSSDVPGHGDFILTFNSPFDWRSPQNGNLWQGVNGVNNPCPSGYRVPTDSELNAERLSWSSSNRAGAFASPLKLPSAGYRDFSNGSLRSVGTCGLYWSSTVFSTYSRYLAFCSSYASMYTLDRANGYSVRCLKD